MTHAEIYTAIISTAGANIVHKHHSLHGTMHFRIRLGNRTIELRDGNHSNFNAGRKNGKLVLVRNYHTINVGPGCINTGIKNLAVWLGYPEKTVREENLKNKRGLQEVIASWPRP